jgi:hypothetical protein
MLNSAKIAIGICNTCAAALFAAKKQAAALASWQRHCSHRQQSHHAVQNCGTSATKCPHAQPPWTVCTLICDVQLATAHFQQHFNLLSCFMHVEHAPAEAMHGGQTKASCSCEVMDPGFVQGDAAVMCVQLQLLCAGRDSCHMSECCSMHVPHHQWSSRCHCWCPAPLIFYTALSLTTQPGG